MLPDESCVTEDKYGCPTILIRSHHLNHFNELITWIRKGGYGRDRGVLKLRLHEQDRMEESCVKDIISLMKEKMKEKIIDEDSKQKRFSFNPEAQTFYRAAVRDPIFQLVDADCTRSERTNFVKNSTNLDQYKINTNCCSDHLGLCGLDGLRQHLFEVVQQSSSCLDSIQPTMVETHKAGDTCPVLYGAGISIDPDKPIKLCGDFSMMELDNVLNELEEKMDGISYPYIYAGELHSAFPWHIEDGGLFSINYVVSGAVKLWFCIASEHFGLVDQIANSLRLPKIHTSCRALLVDHKALVADPEFFKNKYGVPYTTVVQEPGDFIVAFPFALHAGFNLGRNLAISVNFGDVEWIDWGLYAPVCDCNPHQVSIDFTKILEKYRPELVDDYIYGSSLMFPSGHPREVHRLTTMATNQEIKDMNNPKTSAVSTTSKRLKRSTGSIKSRTLYCPRCEQSFKDNKMSRLKTHIRTHHSFESKHLERIATSKYPPWKPKMTKGQTCQVCNEFIRGDKSNMDIHKLRKHMGNRN